MRQNVDFESGVARGAGLVSRTPLTPGVRTKVVQLGGEIL